LAKNSRQISYVEYFPLLNSMPVKISTAIRQRAARIKLFLCAFENSPAIYGWENVAKRNEVPQGRKKDAAVPAGLFIFHD